MTGTAIPFATPSFTSPSWHAPGGGDHRSAEQLARALGKATREGKEWRCFCPAHDDKRHPSLSIRDGDNGKPLLICRSGCTQEQVIEALRKLGLWHYPSNGSNGSGTHKPNGRTDKKPDDWHPIVPPPANTPPPPSSQLRCDTLHEYRDADGNILLYVKRIEAKGERKKLFIPVTFGTLNGKTGWHDKHPRTPKPLYGLDRLAAAPDATVLLVEGEKASDAAQRLFPDYVAMAWMGGAHADSGADLAPLAGRTVIVWPDSDEKGRDAAARLAKRLPNSIILDTSELPDGYDAADLEAERVADPIAWLKARWPQPAPNDEPPHEPPPNDGEAAIEAEVARLAKLTLLQYAAQRTAAGKRLKIALQFLDMLVKAARPADAKDTKQGGVLHLATPEPCPQAVDGAALLTELAEFFTKYAFLPECTSFALALWAAHTYAFELFEHTPRLHIRGVVMNSGKSTVLELLELVACRPLLAENVSGAATFRTIEIAKPSFLLDEADTYLRDNEEMRGILNAGHKRGGQVLRTVGDDHEPRTFSVFCPVAIAGIGKLPGTLANRSITIRMKRALKNELPSHITKTTRAHAAELARKLVRWTQDNEAQLASAEPAMGDDLFNRKGDNWRPLFAIAEVAGGSWPEVVRITAKTLLATDDDDAEPIGVKLLTDIRDVFTKDAYKAVVGIHLTEGAYIASADLVDSLLKFEERPWAEFRRGKPITMNSMARVLKEYAIVPREVGPETARKKGYVLSRFLDAFARLLPPQ